ncbi:hypothetical protein, partial [Ruminococcus sp.]|uniref:hypothetical protein n=1 Tax=Ruminococcus sp. TaxID=41978 RepID=UPI002B9757D4
MQEGNKHQEELIHAGKVHTDTQIEILPLSAAKTLRGIVLYLPEQINHNLALLNFDLSLELRV